MKRIWPKLQNPKSNNLTFYFYIKYRIEFFLNVLEHKLANIKEATKNRTGELQILVSCTSFKAKKGQRTTLSPNVILNGYNNVFWLKSV